MQFTLALVALAAAVHASPVAIPQAVTAVITPSGSAPPGCTPTYAGSFGIAVMNISTAAVVSKRQAVTQKTDGQPNVMTMAPVSMIIDGQIQGGFHTMMMAPVSQIGDGQIQGGRMMAPVTQIIDGQPQAPRITPVPAASQLSDGQPQAPRTTVTTTRPVSQSTDGQPQVPRTTPTSAAAAPATVAPPPAAPTTTTRAAAVPSPSSISTPSAAAPPPRSSSISVPSAAAPPAPSSSSSGSSSGGGGLVACNTPGTLALTLTNGILKDGVGRTGYIASNFQFQFDDPPQAGSLITAGFSVCGNGSLALGGSNVFWQCLSGNFYNLYDRNWAAQCSPVTINTLRLVACS